MYPGNPPLLVAHTPYLHNIVLSVALSLAASENLLGKST